MQGGRTDPVAQARNGEGLNQGSSGEHREETVIRAMGALVFSRQPWVKKRKE
jgi:hypothetical protein